MKRSLAALGCFVLMAAASCSSQTEDKKTPAAASEVWRDLPSSSIPACDAYVRYVCTCAKRHPDVKSLVYGCSLARNMVPEWKTREKPGRDVIVRSCIRAGEALEDSGQCGPFVR